METAPVEKQSAADLKKNFMNTGITNDMKKNPTMDTMKQNEFLATGNPNNQAMLESTKNLNKNATEAKDLKQSSKMLGSTTGFNTTGTVSKPKSVRSEIHVKKWVDYSTKYGLGYILSNGASGVFFNDSTKIILEPKASYFEYIEKKMPDKVEVVNQYTLTNYPKELQKKVTLL
mmetsp:Transcript_5749/g.4936  ORF Transcript_5749/g.4936 Transcript_5749/m.4936 type:complete len:174 (-) Transcript_5749:1115-1636(-)